MEGRKRGVWEEGNEMEETYGETEDGRKGGAL